MKKVVITFFILLLNFSHGKIILKPGVLDFEKLSTSFKELELFKKNLNEELTSKILFKNSIDKSIILLENKYRKKINLTERILNETTILHYKLKKEKIENEEKKIKTIAEKNPSFIEVKKKVIKFITTTKVKTGFGLIIQNEPDMILFMDRYPDFNRIIDEELKANKDGEE